LATIQATIALALLALNRTDDPVEAMQHAVTIWAERR
jgi:hypothetical protein